jgi:hypothetical protein
MPFLGSKRGQVPMTIRDYLTKRKSRLGYWSIVSFVTLVAATAASTALQSPPLHLLAFVSLASYLISVFFYQYRVRCPRCNGNIGRHTSYFGLRKTLFFDTVNHCPFCGVKIDEPVGT